MEVKIATFATVYVRPEYVCGQCGEPGLHMNYALMMRACCKHSIEPCYHRYIGVLACGTLVGLNESDAPHFYNGRDFFDFNCEKMDRFVAFLNAGR